MFSVPATLSRCTARQPFERDLFGWREVLPTRVVQEEIEAAVSLQSGAHHSLSVVAVADISDHP